MAAWRPYQNLIAGELDNTRPGRVTGWISFAAKEGRVTFDLAGDFHRDIRGAKIRFKSLTPVASTEEMRDYMEGFATHQTGVVGDITAGLAPQDYGPYPYIEWYSDHNGRVVLELDPQQLEVIGTPLPWQNEKPVSKDEQARNMENFLAGLSARLGVPAIVVGGVPKQSPSNEAQILKKLEESEREHQPEQDQDQEISR
jgi:hypothetical protein